MGNSRDPVYLTETDIISLVDSIKNRRDKIIFELFYETGCTVNELVKISVEDINLKDNTLTIPAAHTKNKKKRIVQISNKLSKKIFLYKQKNELKKSLFVSRQSNRLTERRVQQIMSMYSKQTLSKQISPHDIRIAHIIHSFIDEKPIPEIEKEIGIQNIQPYIYGYFKQK